MSTAKPWTNEQKQIMREKYPTLGAARVSVLVDHSPKACQEMASHMGLRMSREAISAMHKELCKTAPPKPRQPFADIPDEYVKVSSIWRVGQRCQKMTLVQNSGCAYEAA